MNTPTNDNSFDEYLSRQSQVSRRYRGMESDEVPAHLDERILAQARDALAGTSVAADELTRVRNKRRRLTQWGVPVALAATALLVVSIVIRSGVQQEPPLPLPQVRNAPAAAPSREAAKPQVAQSATANGVVLLAPPRDAVTEFSSLAPAPASANRARRDPGHPAMESITVEETRPLAPVSDVPMSVAPLSAESSDEVAASELYKAEIPAVPPPQMAAAGARNEAAFATARAQAERSVAEEQRQQAIAKQLATPAADVQEVAQEVVITDSSAPRSSITGSGPRNTVPAASPASEARDKEAATDPLRADPEKWLEHIRQMRRDGRVQAADKEWKEFLEAYPDHPVAEADLARSRALR